MQKVTIFGGGDSEKEILAELKSAGIVGISGGRLEVRAKLKRVQTEIEMEDLEGYWAHSTLNHPDTELGYGYDEKKYSAKEAEEAVTKSYDGKAT